MAFNGILDADDDYDGVKGLAVKCRLDLCWGLSHQVISMLKLS